MNESSTNDSSVDTFSITIYCGMDWQGNNNEDLRRQHTMHALDLYFYFSVNKNDNKQINSNNFFIATICSVTSVSITGMMYGYCVLRIGIVRYTFNCRRKEIVISPISIFQTLDFDSVNLMFITIWGQHTTYVIAKNLSILNEFNQGKPMTVVKWSMSRPYQSIGNNPSSSQSIDFSRWAWTNFTSQTSQTYYRLRHTSARLHLHRSVDDIRKVISRSKININFIYNIKSASKEEETIKAHVESNKTSNSIRTRTRNCQEDCF